MKTRRNFLKDAALLAAMGTTAGCRTGEILGPSGAPMKGFAAEPIKGKLRVGFVGVGMHGHRAPVNFANIPCAEVAAICEIDRNALDRSLKEVAAEGVKKPPRQFFGPEAYKALCEWDGVDLIYNATPWAMHLPVCRYAMEHGKHVAVEVPAVMTVEECWELVELSEKYRRHCFQLENGCYGETRSLAINLCHQGVLGEPVYAECGYIHELRALYWEQGWWAQYGHGKWRREWATKHHGIDYPTHGLLPAMFCLDIHSGDRLDHLVSMETGSFGADAYKREVVPDRTDWRHGVKLMRGDLNNTMIRTAKGKTILVQHDVTSPRPGVRLRLVQGTKGVFQDSPLRIYLQTLDASTPDEAPFDPKRSEELHEKYVHPLRKSAGKIAVDLAKRLKAHDGQDLLMCMRLTWCLLNGLPLDIDVYDLAASCAIIELSERSVRGRSACVDIPDFTRGAWRAGAPKCLGTVDMARMGYKV